MRGSFLSERRIFIKKEISGKERLFCTYYSLNRNPREAAAKSGYVFPEKSALRLLRKKEIRSYLDELDKQRRSNNTDIARGFERLAFGCVSDAMKLLFTEGEKAEDLEQMDFFNISEIKKKKGGDIEIKFFDRIKALEKLSLLCQEKEGINGDCLYSAIASSAAALKEDELE